MFKFKSVNTGLLLLRVTVGGLLLLHGLRKVEKPEKSMENIEKALKKHDLPPIMAKGAYMGEVVAPAMMIVGYKTQLAASVMMFNMLTAIYTVNMDKIDKREDNGAWGLEVQGFYLFGSMVLLLTGGGKFAIESNNK